jgi:hypothetical protein
VTDQVIGYAYAQCVSTSRSYAADKYLSGALTIATRDVPLRERVLAAALDHVRHVCPPFADSVPGRTQDRISELLQRLHRGPVVDDDELLLKETVALMSHEELEAVAADIVTIYGTLTP